MISVAGAGRLVGKKTLVRIEKVGRSAASAVLVEGADVVDAVRSGNGAPKSQDDEQKPRRRGRRGGRGRRKSTEGAKSD